MNRTFIVERDFLREVLPREINVNDLYECHAFLYLMFVCFQCGRENMMVDAGGNYPDLDWMKAAALRARTEGWTMVAFNIVGKVNLTCICPDCFKKTLS